MADIVESAGKVAEFGSRLDQFIDLAKSAMKVGGIVAVNSLADKFFGKGKEAKAATQEVVNEVKKEEAEKTQMDAAQEDAVKDALMLDTDTDTIHGSKKEDEEDANSPKPSI